MFPILLPSTLEFICISSLGCLVCYMVFFYVLVSSLCTFFSVSQFSQFRLHVVLSVCLPSHVPCSLSVFLLFYCQVYMSLFGSQSACHFLFHFDGPLSHVHSVQFVSPVSLCLICACCAPVCFQSPYHSVAPCPSLCSPFLMSSRFHGYFVFSRFRLLVGFSFFLYICVQPK